jgi:hypothetical protein
MLLFSGLIVMPVLVAGVLTTVIGGAIMLIERTPLGLREAAFAALSVGGVLGCIGYLRAHRGALKPDRHNATATLVCLGIGVVTGLCVTGFIVAEAFRASSPWSDRSWLAIPGLFAAANCVWVVSGIAWMQRLARRHAEQTRRAVDGLPALLLFVAIALATAAALTTAAL